MRKILFILFIGVLAFFLWKGNIEEKVIAQVVSEKGTNNVFDIDINALSTAYGYLKGQQFTLDRIKKEYPELNIEVIRCELEFSLSFKNAAKNIFVPITAGGGVRSINDVQNLLNSGADKVSINTAAIKNPSLITEISEKFGSQCMVLSIEACKQNDGSWEAYTDNGREHSKLDVLEWAIQAEKLGAGEILLTSVDFDGTQKGFDYDLIKLVSKNVSIPVIASGGFGDEDDFKKVVNDYSADAVAIGSALHYEKFTVKSLKNKLKNIGLNVR